MSVELFNQYVETMYISKDKLDEFWLQYKTQKENVKNESLIKFKNRKIFASVLRLHGKYFGEMNEIRGIDFSFVNLSHTDLSNLIFIDCNFESALLNASILGLGTFENCNLKNTIFSNTHLESVQFFDCNLNKSNFDRAHLVDAYFENCDLTGTSFKGTNLLEFEAKDTIIQEIIIDNNTSINLGKFENVDWSKVDVSYLNISIEQTKYFLNCSKGLSKTQVYDKNYSVSDSQIIQDAIYNDLCNKKLTDAKLHSNLNLDVFISYAREKEEHASSLAKTLESKYNVWWDHLLEENDMLNDVVSQVIDECKIAIVLMSKEYLMKGWTRYELFELLRKAKNTQFKLIVLIDNSKVNVDSEDVIKYNQQTFNQEKSNFENNIDVNNPLDSDTIIKILQGKNIIFSYDIDTVQEIVDQMI
jgi:uncharacterized protein YjbI with pentapeptide repeats